MNELLMGIPVEPIKGMPLYTPYAGSIKVKADCCGALVWQGPEQQKLRAAKPETKIVCALCVARESIKQGVMPTVKALREGP